MKTVKLKLLLLATLITAALLLFLIPGNVEAFQPSDSAEGYRFIYGEAMWVGDFMYCNCREGYSCGCLVPDYYTIPPNE